MDKRRAGSARVQRFVRRRSSGKARGAIQAAQPFKHRRLSRPRAAT